MSGMRRIRWAVLAALGLGLAACGGGEAPAAAPRPVLVEQPRPAADAAHAFPGEVRGRVESTLAFRVGGILVDRDVDAGDRVVRGQRLARLDAGDFEAQARAAQARLVAAEAQLRRAAADRARYAALAGDQLVSRSALDAQEAAWRAAEGEARAARAQAEVAGNQAAYAELRAPADGVVAARHAEAGQVVAAGQAVFTLAAGDGREVAIALPEQAVGGFEVGQPVEIELWTAPGERLRGRFREISPAADPVARTYAARVEIDPADAPRVALGQSARVLATADGATLTVPLAALQGDDDGHAVVWVVEDGQAHARRVVAGAYGSERVPIESGLARDDLVVAAGGHLLREGQAVHAVDRRNRPVATGPR